MAKFTGRRVDLGIARETTRGTAVAPTYWVPKIDFAFDDAITKARSEAGVGTLADSEEAFVTTRYSTGDLTGEVRLDSIGLFLYGMLGSVSTAGPTDSAYTHSFSLSESNQHQSLSLTVADPINTELYKLVMLDTFEINAALDEVVKFSASFMGKKSNAWTTIADSYSAETKFTKKHVAVKVATNLAGLAAASAISIKSLGFTVSKNTELDDVLGTAEPEDILNKSISIEGQLSLNYEDATFKDYFTNGTARALEIKFTNTDATIGASTRPSLTIQLPNVDFFEWTPAYNNDEVTTQEVSFKASTDLVGGNDIISTCDLVNDVSSY